MGTSAVVQSSMCCNKGAIFYPVKVYLLRRAVVFLQPYFVLLFLCMGKKAKMDTYMRIWMLFSILQNTMSSGNVFCAECTCHPGDARSTNVFCGGSFPTPGDIFDATAMGNYNLYIETEKGADIYALNKEKFDSLFQTIYILDHKRDGFRIIHKIDNESNVFSVEETTIQANILVKNKIATMSSPTKPTEESLITNPSVIQDQKASGDTPAIVFENATSLMESTPTPPSIGMVGDPMGGQKIIHFFTDARSMEQIVLASLIIIVCLVIWIGLMCVVIMTMRKDFINYQRRHRRPVYFSTRHGVSQGGTAV